MITRLYVHNLRCLVNFELDLSQMRSSLIVGRNGAGKSSLIEAIRLLGQLALGKVSLGAGLPETLFSRIGTVASTTQQPPNLHLEIEAVLAGNKLCRYVLVIEWPKMFDSPRIREERLVLDGATVVSRIGADTSFYADPNRTPATFPLDWHQCAVSQIQEPDEDHPLYLFKLWLSSILALQPSPSKMLGGRRWAQPHIGGSFRARIESP